MFTWKIQYIFVGNLNFLSYGRGVSLVACTHLKKYIYFDVGNDHISLVGYKANIERDKKKEN